MRRQVFCLSCSLIIIIAVVGCRYNCIIITIIIITRKPTEKGGYLLRERRGENYYKIL